MNFSFYQHVSPLRSSYCEVPANSPAASARASRSPSTSGAIEAHRCAGKAGRVRWAPWQVSGCSAGGTLEWDCGRWDRVCAALEAWARRSSFPSGLQSSSSFWQCSESDRASALECTEGLRHSSGHWFWVEEQNINTPYKPYVLYWSLESGERKADIA